MIRLFKYCCILLINGKKVVVNYEIFFHFSLSLAVVSAACIALNLINVARASRQAQLKYNSLCCASASIATYYFMFFISSCAICATYNFMRLFFGVSVCRQDVYACILFSAFQFLHSRHRRREKWRISTIKKKKYHHLKSFPHESLWAQKILFLCIRIGI